MEKDTIGRHETQGRDENAMTNARILVVRSDGPDAEGLEQCLQGLGYNVCAVAASAAEAIEKAAETAPDAALIDLDLGADVNGLEAAARIGSELDVPVVCLTDGAGGTPFPPASTAYPFGYVLKPFDGQQLRLTLLTALSLRERESRDRETRSRLEREIDEMRDQVDVMEAIFNSMEEGVIAADKNGQRLAFNSGAARLSGDPELTDKIEKWAALHGVYRLDKETLLPVDENPLVLAMRGQETDGVEVFVRNEQQPQGIYVSVTGRPLKDTSNRQGGGLVVFRDITGRKATEIRLQQTIGELREQSELLQTILDSIQEGIIVSDQSGEFLYVNPGAKEILDQEYFVRRQGKWSEKSKGFYFYPDRVTPIENVDLPLPRAIFNGEATDDMNIFVRRPNQPNGGIYLRVSARPLLDEVAEIRGGVLIFRDITHRVLAEEALMQAFAEGRLEVVDTILHNIGNAINSVTAGTETLYWSFTNHQLVRRLRALADAIKPHADDWIDYIENDPQGQKVRPFIIALAEDFVRRNSGLARTVERVRDRAQHIADIVRTQRSPGRSGTNRKDVDLRNALSDAINVVRDSLGNGGIRIDVDCAKAPREIRIQESQFHQMMVNLIKNSVQAIHELEESDGIEEEPRIRIRAGIEGDFLNLEVSDNGIGFGGKDTRMLFAAGYTTKAAGTGLGLHSAANFVVGSGGRIDLSSDGVGKGATARVMLRLFPRAGQPGEAGTPASVDHGEDG